VQDFAKLLGRFFAREFVYFLGGSFFLASIVFIAKHEDVEASISWAKDFPTVLLFPLAGLAHVVGYLLNLILGLGLNSASDRLLPWSSVDPWRGAIARFVFWAINRYSLDDIVKFIDNEPAIKNANNITPAMLFAFQALNPTQDYLSRGVTLHHVSSVIGASFLACSIVFFSACCFQNNQPLLLLGFATLFSGVILCMDSCYRAFQVAFARLMLEKWRSADQDMRAWD
jgi:hypothetical protein